MQKKTPIDWRYRHGDSPHKGKRHPLYNAWDNMLARCNRVNHPQFKYYGGRGIKVCPKWTNYLLFKQWALANGWQKGLSLDRSNNDKGYYPSNCRWVDKYTQMSNTRWNKFLELDGKRLTISQWSRETGLGVKTIQCRIKYGWSVERTLRAPVMSRRECGFAAHL